MTDVSNASRTMLFDIHKLRLGRRAAARSSTSRATMLPEVRGSTASFGDDRPRSLGRGIPIAGIAGDQQAALFGQACFAPGMAKNTYGTGCFLLMNTGDEAPSTRRPGCSTTVAWRRRRARPIYALEGSVFIAGAAIQWLRDGLQHHRAGGGDRGAGASRCPTRAASTSSRPSSAWARRTGTRRARRDRRPDARDQAAAHIARAALEAIAYQTRDMIEAMAGRRAALARAARGRRRDRATTS